MLVVCSRTLKNLTAFEVWQGSVLGLFAGIGLVFQMDGLAYTEASTSAFLTQFYCLTIPVWVAWRSRRWPSLLTALSCSMVVGGVAVLSHLEWRSLRIGRGELETLIASIIFTGQILWLQRPQFARNNVNHFTLVMFVVIALCGLPVAVASASPLDSWLAAYRSAPAWVFVMVLTVFCTLGGYCLMNYFQPCLTATQAGLLYCLEPVFASAFALFLPAWYSSMAGVQYANETLETSLLVGGGLITAANVLSVLGASSPGPEPAGSVRTQGEPAA